MNGFSIDVPVHYRGSSSSDVSTGSNNGYYGPKLTRRETKECRRLCSNDPTLRSVHICRLNAENARVYGESLLCSNFVQSLTITVPHDPILARGRTAHDQQQQQQQQQQHQQDAFDFEDIELILEYIQCSKTLKDFHLWNVHNVDIMNAFLDVLSANFSLEEVSFINTVLPVHTFNDFLCQCKNVNKLAMTSTQIGYSKSKPSSSPGLKFSRNKSLEEVKFVKVEEQFLIHALNELKYHAHLRKLCIIGDIHHIADSNKPSESIRRLLAGSKTLQSLQFQTHHFDVTSFQPIYQGIQESSTLNQLAISECKFDNDASQLFQSLFQTEKTSNIRSLKLSNHIRTEGLVLAKFLSRILTESTTLVELDIEDLDMRRSFESYDIPNGFNVLFESAAKIDADDCSVKTLRLGRIETVQKLNTLASTIPQIEHLREIYFRLNTYPIERSDVMTRYPIDSPASIAPLMQAFQQNFSFHKIEFQSTFLEREDRKKMQGYCARNKWIKLLALDPLTIPDTYWASVFQVSGSAASSSGRNAIFKALLSVSMCQG